MSQSSPQRPSVRVPSTKAAGTPDEVARLDGLGLDEVAAWFALRRHVELTLYGAVTMLAAVFALTAEAVVNTTAGLVAVMWASGIGLMVVQRIVQNHGGSIAVHSRPGEGTTFRVYLPATSADPVGAPGPATIENTG